jgi:hypothetical protein
MSKKILVVEAGEEFAIHIKAPVCSVSDPMGYVGGSTFELTAAEDRSHITPTKAYTVVRDTDFPLQPTDRVQFFKRVPLV